MANSQPIPDNPRFQDLTGKSFGRLSVICFVGKCDDNIPRWLCRCQCGVESIFRGACLKSGDTTSCGCYQREGASRRLKSHGMSKTTLYRRWRGMWNRATRINGIPYKNYGGRGIRICDRWKRFENFRDDMGPSFQQGLELDRIDNDGNYEPGNCRWVTRVVQQRNTRQNHKLTFRGETRTIVEWSEITGISTGAINMRVNKYKWPIERALTEPVMTPDQRAVYREKMKENMKQ